MEETKINLCQIDRKKKVWRRLETAHDPKYDVSNHLTKYKKSILKKQEKGCFWH